ncbi:MAG: hypothetical protein IJ779_11455, partial [Ruminococcus sp.]|nr:hypothetical protein [Ruminococcus sp.]
MFDKKAIALLKKYYLPYNPDGKPTESEVKNAVAAGVLVPDSVMSHDEIISEIKALAQRIDMDSAAEAFLYSLSSGDTRYRTAISSLVWARSLPVHTASVSKYGTCEVCGCCHGLAKPETIDWNRYGVFRYLPPKQYGNTPEFTSAEYVLNDLREFEKLPAVSHTDEDINILNKILGAVKQMKSHNKSVALISEIRSRNILSATGNAIH